MKLFPAVWIEIDSYEGVFRFWDDGCGCKNPKNITTLDYSAWNSTDEGFGIGILSCLGLPKIEQIIFESENWRLKIDAKSFLEGNEASAEKELLSNKRKGFYVEIKSDYIRDYYNDLIHRITRDGEIQPYNVFYESKLIPPKDLFSEVNGDFVMEFRNKFFDAKLCISKDLYYSPNIYYEKRHVTDAYCFCKGAIGVIELKKNAVNLKEPDRQGIIINEKSNAFGKELVKCRKKLYLEFIKQSSPELLDKYALTISEILSVDDYENLIEIEDECFEKIEEKRNLSEMPNIDAFKMLLDNISTKERDSQLSLFESNINDVDLQNISKLLNSINPDPCVKWVKTNKNFENTMTLQTTPITEDIINNANELVIGGIVWEKINVEKEDKLNDHCGEITFNSIIKKKRKNTLYKTIKSAKKKVWIKAEDLITYEELKAKAEYYGIKVFVAKNIMYEKVFEKHNTPYIDEITKNIKVKNYVSNIGAKTNKEEAFLELTKLVSKYYNLPSTTFDIANLKLITETIFDGQVVDREVTENTKDSIKIKGLCEGSVIYLDRRALGLQRFNLIKGELGKNQYKAILASLMTISHELSHMMYQTVDNTIIHYDHQIEIFNELEKYFNSL